MDRAQLVTLFLGGGRVAAFRFSVSVLPCLAFCHQESREPALAQPHPTHCPSHWPGLAALPSWDLLQFPARDQEEQGLGVGDQLEGGLGGIVPPPGISS